MAQIECRICSANILQNTYDKQEGLCAPCYKKEKQYEEIKRFVSTPGCPNCDGSRYITFSWKDALKNDSGFGKYKKYILPIKKLKYGTLYKCKVCNIHWWLDTKSTLIYLITQERFLILEKWNMRRYKLSMKQLIELSKINKTPTDIYGNRSEYNIFPCSIITKNNKNYEKSIIQITNLPPLHENPNFILFVDEINEIMPSPYSLPMHIRKATAMAQEIRMGFSPTLVKSHDDRKFILNGPLNFFDYKQLKGENMQLMDTSFNFQEKNAEYYRNNEENVFYFYADISWFNMGILKLLSK